MIHIRKRPLKNEGRFALFLECYHNKKQWFESLSLYLENEKNNPTAKQANKQTMLIAEKIKVDRLYRLQNDVHGFKQPSKTYLTFNEYFCELWEQRKRTGVNVDSWDSTYKHLNKFNSKVLLTEVTERFLEEFKAYLLARLKVNSASSYFNIFKRAIHEAFRERLLKDDPAVRVKCIREVDTKKEFLTKEEIDKFIETECRYPALKRAFLFSCFTGLRWSDVQKLTWDEVREAGDVTYIAYTQKKIRNSELLPIPEAAKKLLGEKVENKDRVFIGLNYSNYTNVALLQWYLKAGITKHITFHCARHTNAILLLNNGVDIYTVSKMLGHKDLKTTSVYAKVLNKTKIDAVKKLPEFTL